MTEPAPTRWRPIGADQRAGPPPAGRLIAELHAVWHVDHVHDCDGQAPDNCQPYTVHATWVAGHRPAWVATHTCGTALRAVFRVNNFPADPPRTWHVYPTNRWTACLCCGEPAPCRRSMHPDPVGAATTTQKN